jgi:hypothetical protein
MQRESQEVSLKDLSMGAANREELYKKLSMILDLP